MTPPRPPRLRRPPGAALAAAAALLGALPAGAHAWSTPTPIDQAVRTAPVTVGGDAAGNAFAVLAGAGGDVPLLLAERPATNPPPGGAPLTWTGSEPMPGGIPEFTTSSPSVDAVAAAGGGEGSGAIAVRNRDGAGNLMTLLLRDPGRRFADPITVAGTKLGRLGEPVLAMSAAGTTVLAFTASRNGSRRVTAAGRLTGNRLGGTRTLSAAGAGTPAAAVGPGERAFVAWARGTRLEVSRFDADVRPLKAVTLGRALRGTPVAAAGSAAGAVVAWVGADRTVRAARRAASGRFGPARVVAPAGPGLRRLIAAIDPAGLATLAWLEGTGAATSLAVATLRPGAAPRVTRPASGAGLGPPGIAGRPSGGAVLAWAAPAGWSSVRSDAKGVFQTVAVVDPGAPAWRERPFVLAGPASRVDVLWIEPTADRPGAQTLTESSEVDQPSG
ncbi:MAG: hypothetical protein MUC84_03200 [Solirubrobacteraceae bacterium]|nr:hypothetical protein [Solirubrobacteraceae bacterium]